MIKVKGIPTIGINNKRKKGTHKRPIIKEEPKYLNSRKPNLKNPHDGTAFSSNKRTLCVVIATITLMIKDKMRKKTKVKSAKRFVIFVVEKDLL